MAYGFPFDTYSAIAFISRSLTSPRVIGGMLSSTFLTLFIVPMVYTAFSAVAADLCPPPASKKMKSIFFTIVLYQCHRAVMPEV